jgi:FixJ family two-component response regulator
MAEHRSLTERERVVIAAVVDTGHIKGAAAQLGISESGAYRRVEYARVRCGCGSLVELVYTHHHELSEGVTTPTTEPALSA